MIYRQLWADDYEKLRGKKESAKRKAEAPARDSKKKPKYKEASSDEVRSILLNVFIVIFLKNYLIKLEASLLQIVVKHDILTHFMLLVFSYFFAVF